MKVFSWLARLCALVIATLTFTPKDAAAEWGGWESLGGVILEEQSCVSWGENRIDCFARGTDAAMHHRWWDGNAWGGWESLGGVILEQPECVSWGPNRIDCFARGTDAAMYHRWWDGNSWGGWESLGGVILDAPECVSWGPNRIDCFARGTDAAMHHMAWDGSHWIGWESLGGVILDAPECISWGANRIDCFARGTDRAMYQMAWDGNAWVGWNYLGGTLLEQPSCVSWGVNRIDCFGRGTDAAMYQMAWDGGNWVGWNNLGGVLLEQPDCTSWGVNRIDCFVRGTDRAMYQMAWDGSNWVGWFGLGGTILEQPECVAWGTNRLDCFARGTDRAMYHRWWAEGSPRAARTITVSRHNRATLSDADADRILRDMSSVLQTSDGPGDVACNVEIVRNGPVGVFTATDGNINTSAELQQVFNLPGNVKVINEVDWCANRLNTSFIGCGQTPGPSFITERFTSTLEGILWAHEYGHNQGRPHREDTSDALMFPSIGTNRLRINAAECAAFEGSGGLLADDAMAAVVTERAIGEVGMPGEELLILAQAAGEETLMPVLDFVRQIWFEGLPLDTAALYGTADVAPLVALLNDPAEVQFHENAALTLGMIGSDEAVAPLIAYLEAAPQTDDPDAARAAFKGGVGALMGLGYLVNQTENSDALAYLTVSAEPATWAETPLVARTAPDMSETDTRESLSGYAILALGISGDARALAFLQTVEAGTSPLDPGFVEGIGEKLDQSLLLNQQVIQRGGIAEYYEQVR